MKYFCKLRIKFNFSEIRQECLRLEKKAKIYKSDLSKKSMRAISLMSYSGDQYDFRALPGAHDFRPTPALDPNSEIHNFLKRLPGKLFSVRLLSLEPQGELVPHLDYNIGLGYGIVRLHLPIVTTAKALFTIEDERLHLSKGSVWFADVSRFHSVINKGSGKRLHLVIDLCLNKDYKKLFPKRFLDDWVKRNGEIEYLRELKSVTKSSLQGVYFIPHMFQPDSLKIYETENFKFSRERDLVMAPLGSSDKIKLQKSEVEGYVFPTLGPSLKILKLKKEWYFQVRILIKSSNHHELFEQVVLLPLKRVST